MKKMYLFFVIFSALVCLSGCYTTGGFRGGVGLYNRYESLQPIVINGITYYPAVQGTVYDSRYYGTTYYNGSMYYRYNTVVPYTYYRAPRIHKNESIEKYQYKTKTQRTQNENEKQNNRSSGSTRTTKKR